MDFHVSLGDRGDRATRIYRELLEAVLDGRLRPAERLPPTRELAERLAVSRNTVAVAYERLTAEGFLVAKVGAGTFVREDPIEHARPRAAPGGGDVQPRALWRSMPAPSRGGGKAPMYDFRVGTPDARLFPLEAWRRLVAGELRISGVLSADYSPAAGHPGLRAAIARYSGVSRSVRASADDVVVTQGAQQALDLIGRVLLEPGDKVAVEEPGYPPARLLFRSLGAQLVEVPVDDEGLDVSAIPRGVKLVYTTPSHQFPLGTPMSLARRKALLDWAARTDAVIVEDDYDSEYRYEDRPLEPLQSIDRSGRVLYVGSFSKTMLPMLRLGFLVAPASLRPALLLAKQLTDWHGELATQAALARFLDEGLFARHVRKATKAYGERRSRILETLRKDLSDVVEIVPSVAGLHLCVLVQPGVSLAEVISRATSDGVGIQPLSDFCATPPTRDGLVIGYGSLQPESLDAGLRVLSAALRTDSSARR